jgi:hypothetical protein
LKLCRYTDEEYRTNHCRTEFLGDKKKKAGDIKVRIRRFAAALELVNYLPAVEAMLGVLHQYSFCQGSKNEKAITDILRRLQTNSDKITFSQVPDILHDLTTELCSMKVFQLQYFAKIRKAQELIGFFRAEADFPRKIEFLRGTRR